MTRRQFQMMWLIIGVGLLLASTYVHGGLHVWLERLSLYDLGGLLWWEISKDWGRRGR